MPQSTVILRCHFVPNAMDQVRVEDAGPPFVVRLAALLRLCGRRCTDELYLRGVTRPRVTQATLTALRAAATAAR